MRVGPEAAENEVVLAFVQAEFDAQPFSLARQILGQLVGADALKRFVEQPNLGDPVEDFTRAFALALGRGYGLATLLFTGFPTDVRWMRLALTREELGLCRYLNMEEPRTWKDLSADSFLVRDGAANLDEVEVGVNDKIRGIVAHLKAEEVVPEIVIVGEESGGPYVLLEGHARATAHFLSFPESGELEVIAGHSNGMARWAFWHTSN